MADYPGLTPAHWPEAWYSCRKFLLLRSQPEPCRAQGLMKHLCQKSLNTVSKPYSSDTTFRIGPSGKRRRQGIVPWTSQYGKPYMDFSWLAVFHHAFQNCFSMVRVRLKGSKLICRFPGVESLPFPADSIQPAVVPDFCLYSIFNKGAQQNMRLRNPQ